MPSPKSPRELSQRDAMALAEARQEYRVYAQIEGRLTRDEAARKAALSATIDRLEQKRWRLRGNRNGTRAVPPGQATPHADSRSIRDLLQEVDRAPRHVAQHYAELRAHLNTREAALRALALDQRTTGHRDAVPLTTARWERLHPDVLRWQSAHAPSAVYRIVIHRDAAGRPTRYVYEGGEALIKGWARTFKAAAEKVRADHDKRYHRDHGAGRRAAKRAGIHVSYTIGIWPERDQLPGARAIWYVFATAGDPHADRWPPGTRFVQRASPSFATADRIEGHFDTSYPTREAAQAAIDAFVKRHPGTRGKRARA